jgi:hypothetical protein
MSCVEVNGRGFAAPSGINAKPQIQAPAILLSFRPQSVFNHGRFEPTILPRAAAQS